MKEEKKDKWGGWFWLLPVAAFLAVGGLIAMVTMKDAAEKLVGRPQAGDMSSSGGVRTSGSIASHDFFSSDENISGEAIASYERHKLEVEDRLYEKPSSGKVTAFSASGPAAGGGGSADNASAANGRSAAPSGAGGHGARLSSSLAAAGGRGNAGASRSSLGAAGASAFQGSGAKPSVVSSTGEQGLKGGKSRGGGGGVIEALRSAWRGSVMGARDASNDAARTLVARSFDGSPSSERLSLQYDEKMKKELDLIDPNSVPKFLRDQDLSSDRATAFDVPDIKDVKVDRAGTEAALKEDKKFQDALSTMADGMLNPMFGGVTNKNGAAPEAPDDPGGGVGGLSIPDTPADDQWLNDLSNEYLMNEAGFEDCGESCGCSCAAPCCCLPEAPTGCPLYGPFLPDDPCGSDFGTTPLGGDGGIWV